MTVRDHDTAREAFESLEAALQMYIDARRSIPMPAAVGDGSVALGALPTAKVLLSNEMVKQASEKPNWRDAWAFTCRK